MNLFRFFVVPLAGLLLLAGCTSGNSKGQPSVRPATSRPSSTAASSASAARTTPAAATVWTTKQAAAQFLGVIKTGVGLINQISALLDAGASTARVHPLYVRLATESARIAQWLQDHKSNFPVSIRPLVEQRIQSDLEQYGLTKQFAACADQACLDAVPNQATINDRDSAINRRFRLALGLPLS